jgi:hypothetical protein
MRATTTSVLLLCAVAATAAPVRVEWFGIAW